MGEEMIADKMPVIFQKREGGWMDICSISALIRGVVCSKTTKKNTFCRTKPSMIRAESIPSKMLI